jgi:hypothetical protein
VEEPKTVFSPTKKKVKERFSTTINSFGLDLSPVDVALAPDGAFLMMYQHRTARVLKPPPDPKNIVEDLNRFASAPANDGVAFRYVYGDGSLGREVDLKQEGTQAQYGVGIATVGDGHLLVTNLAHNIGNYRGFELVRLSNLGEVVSRKTFHAGENLRLRSFATNDEGQLFVVGTVKSDDLGEKFVWKMGDAPPPRRDEVHGYYWAMFDSSLKLLWEHQLLTQSSATPTGAVFAADGHPCFAASQLDQTLLLSKKDRSTGETIWSKTNKSGGMHTSPYLFETSNASLVVLWKSWADSAPALQVAVHDASGELTGAYIHIMGRKAEDLASVIQHDGGFVAVFEENYSGREPDVDYLHLLRVDNDGRKTWSQSVSFDRLSGYHRLGLDHRGQVMVLNGTYQQEHEVFDVLVGDERFQPGD